jgi:hypothetical protein
MTCVLYPSGTVLNVSLLCVRGIQYSGGKAPGIRNLTEVHAVTTTSGNGTAVAINRMVSEP